MKKLTILFVYVLLAIVGRIGSAYDTETHREIGHRAADPDVSSLDQFLKAELGIQNGIRETFPGLSISGPRTVRQLIGDGAFFEDVPGFRSLNHFHNPLQPWEDAGLRALTVPILGFDLIRGQSSVLWQQNTSQDTTSVLTPIPFLSGGGNWSWQAARQQYLEALTGSSRDGTRLNREQRERALVQTFRRRPSGNCRQLWES